MMMMMMSGSNGGAGGNSTSNSTNNNKYPFTASQWQELENQALIFKYMACGYPIPSDLILHIRRSVLMDSTTAASLFPLQPTIGGWGCYQMSGGRKVTEDPEPGRCRRTDGKKWRCSKEACQDSKYCERHMHRGKNRSRKPVEMSLNTSNSSNNNNSSNGTNTYSGSSSLSIPITPASENNNNNNQPSSYPYGPYSSYSIRPPVMGLATHKDWRYYHGLKAAEMEQYTTCFSESSEGRERNGGGSWRFTPLGMSSLGESKQQQQQYGNEEKNQTQNQNQRQDSFALGTTDLEFKLGRDEETHHHPKPIRHFFNDWSSSASSLKRVGYEEEEDQSSFSKTQLSISIPATVNHHHHQQHLLQNLSKDDSTD